MKKPLLSIGMIFRDDVRSLERCLKALAPIREAVPCELVMADTGSKDGSREIAEKYADILFDFPWIQDFSAARNAVMDRCSGEWYLTVDSDEYLDENIQQLAGFLQNPQSKNYSTCLVIQRNYQNYELEGAYTDFFAVRMLRMATGMRYSGKIHERWDFPQPPPCTALNQTVLDHDGYVGLNGPEGKEKRERNLKLIRGELEKNPDELLRLLQYLESGQLEWDYVDRLRHAVEVVKARGLAWKTMGPPILRYAAMSALRKGLPEKDEWIRLADEMFPDSYFIRIDVPYEIMIHSLNDQNYEECIRRGEALMEAYQDYRQGKGDLTCQMYSTILQSAPDYEQVARIMLINAYLESGRPEEALAAFETLLDHLHYPSLTAKQVEGLTKTLCNLQTKSMIDTGGLVQKLWEKINVPEPGEKKARERRLAFLLIGSTAFPESFRQSEAENEERKRHVYTAFLPLADACPLGIAAAMLETEEPAELSALLSKVEKWTELPVSAFLRALEAGVRFPLPERPLNVEAADDLAARLARDQDALRGLIDRAVSGDFSGNWQSLIWTRALVLAAVQSLDWKEKGDMDLARTFARVEKAFVAACYSPEALGEGGLCAVPAMHRFGWYCARAFDALEAGDAVGCARFLRRGLAANEGAKAIVDYLTEQTPELQAPPPSPELLALAEKVRAILAQYPPEDPAVLALKSSPAYQKVAHLIEGEPA